MNKHINMVVNDSNFGNGIKEYIENKGVENPEEFMSDNKSLSYYTESEALYNMDNAVNLVKQGIQDGKHFGIVVDQDFDGYASSAMIYRLLVNEGAFVELISSNKKVHGIDTLRQQIIMDYDSDIIIIPDGGVNDYNSITDLVGRDINVIVLDHHLINRPDKVNNLGAYMVSSQNPENLMTNENFTGAGIAERFVNAFYGQVDYIYQTLASVGQVADISDTSDIEIRGLVVRGLEHFNQHPFFKEFGIPSPVYQNDIGWSVSPLINAVSRFGTLEERLNIVRALSGTLDENPYIVKEKRKKNKTTGKFDKIEVHVNEYNEVYEMAKKVKAKQEKELKETMKSISWLIEPEVNNIAVALIPNDKNSAVTGLIANKLQSKYSQPILVGRDIKHHFWGSLRSPGQFPFSTWANETGLIKATGHEQAAGANFDISNTTDIVKVSKELDFNGHPTEVDIMYDSFVDKRQLENINKYEQYYGGLVNKPIVGIKNLKIKKSNINTKTSMISFLYNDVQFVMYKAEKVIEFIKYETGFTTDLSIDLVGSVGETDWGKKMPQIMIQDIAINLNKKIDIEDKYIF